jgi:hypothetical protein
MHVTPSASSRLQTRQLAKEKAAFRQHLYKLPLATRFFREVCEEDFAPCCVLRVAGAFTEGSTLTAL